MVPPTCHGRVQLLGLDTGRQVLYVLDAEDMLIAVFLGQKKDTRVIRVNEVIIEINDGFIGVGSFREPAFPQVHAPQECQGGLFAGPPFFFLGHIFVPRQISGGFGQLGCDIPYDFGLGGLGEGVCLFLGEELGDQRHGPPKLGHVKILAGPDKPYLCDHPPFLRLIHGNPVNICEKIITPGYFRVAHAPILHNSCTVRGQYPVRQDMERGVFAPFIVGIVGGKIHPHQPDDGPPIRDRRPTAVPVEVYAAPVNSS